MRQRVLFVILTAFIAALPYRVTAQSVLSTVDQLRRLNVSGVYVGMRHDEAMEKLRQAGWTISAEEDFPTQPSYKSAVASSVQAAGVNVASDKTTAPWFTSLVKPGEKIRLRHLTVPSGAMVDQLKYSASQFQLGRSAFQSMVRQRYGTETTTNALDGSLIYCIEAAARDCDKDASMAAPMLWAGYQGDGSFMIVSELGWSIREAIDRKLQSDVQAALGRSKPSF